MAADRIHRPTKKPTAFTYNSSSYASTSSRTPRSLTTKVEPDEDFEIPDVSEDLQSSATSAKTDAWRQKILQTNKRIHASDSRTPLGPSHIKSNASRVASMPDVADAPDMRLLPTLHGGSAYSYDCGLYRVQGNAITLKISDGSRDRVPEEGMRIRKLVAGEVNYYYPVSPDDKNYVHWQEIIGEMLALHVLGKRQPVNGPRWKLARFPAFYGLWRQKKGYVNDGQEPRTDPYLYGSSSVHKFRTPMEFAEHAIWLMRGRAGDCRCRYCVGGNPPQKPITARLLGYEVDDDADEEEVKEEDQRPATRKQKPRQLKGRDRPIMAKDYRVAPQAQS